MKHFLLAVLALGCCSCSVHAQGTPAPQFKPTEVTTTGSVTVNGKLIHYRAVTGTLVVHAKGWNRYAPAGDKKNPSAEWGIKPRSATVAGGPHRWHTPHRTLTR